MKTNTLKQFVSLSTRAQNERHFGSTHCNKLRVDAQIFPISTAHISQHAAGGERGQEVANAWPGRVASAAEVGGDGVIHSVDVLLLQVGGIRVAGGQRGEGRSS